MTHAYSLVGEAIKEKPLHYTGCGLDDVYLLNGYNVQDTRYGKAIAVKKLEGLHKAIGYYLVRQKKLLKGKELRFLRTQMDLTQSELGRLLGYSDQQVARWEKDQSRIPGPANRILRLLFREHLGSKDATIREVLEVMDQLDSRLSDKQVFEKTPQGWRAAA